MSRLIIGLTGPMGSGCSTIAKHYFRDIKGFRIISLSDILRDMFFEKNPKWPKGQTPSTEEQQEFGNTMRTEHGNEVFAKKALGIISNDQDNERFIIDSIRNPGEVEELRSSDQEFYLLGVFADPENRWQRVRAIFNNDSTRFNSVERRDRGEEESENGQRVIDCFLDADIIIINNYSLTIRGERILNNSDWNELRDRLDEYYNLVCDFENCRAKATPSEVETAMAIAYANSKKSLCMRRQVGAVLVDQFGNIFSSGYNEVPTGELPCIKKYGDCYRQQEKEKIRHKLESVGLEEDQICDVMKEIKILEKCRSRHAEENAILNVIRFGSSIAMKQSTIYTTTFPCNLCANKIVDVGVHKVVYFEPYPQKEAKDILKDNQIELEPFEGVTYRSFFKLYSC